MKEILIGSRDNQMLTVDYFMAKICFFFYSFGAGSFSAHIQRLKDGRAFLSKLKFEASLKLHHKLDHF